jgi:ElaB/YqjD/DUF883 family membrane-anchored ribosome-binding protein
MTTSQFPKDKKGSSHGSSTAYGTRDDNEKQGSSSDASISGALGRGSVAIAGHTTRTAEELSKEVTELRDELTKMQQTVTRYATNTGSEVMRTAKGVGTAVANTASGIAEAGTDMANSATAQVKTFASDLEAMARNSPTQTLAGTLVVGLFIGFFMRGRS